MSASTGAVPHTTNHCRGLQAIIQGFAALREPCQVELYTDSHDVITRLTGGRARTHHNVVARLLAAAAPHYLSLHDRRGHAGYPDRTRVDTFTQQAAYTGVGTARRRGLTCHRAPTWPVALMGTDAHAELAATTAS